MSLRTHPRTTIQYIKPARLKRAFRGIRTRKEAMNLNPRFREGESKTRIAMGQYGREENARLFSERVTPPRRVRGRKIAS